MKDMTKKFLAFDMNRDGVSCMGPEVNKHRMFERITSTRNVERFFDLRDDSVYFFDFSTHQVAMHFDNRCNVYAPIERDVTGKYTEYGVIGKICLADGDVWNYEQEVPGPETIILNAETPLIAEIKVFDIWYTNKLIQNDLIRISTTQPKDVT